MNSLEALRELLAQGATIEIKDKELKCTLSKPIPTELKDLYIELKDTIRLAIITARNAGYQFMWSARIQDLVLLQVDRRHIESYSLPGIVSYRLNEIEYLQRLTNEELKHIHTAKRIFTGTVIKQPDIKVA